MGEKKRGAAILAVMMITLSASSSILLSFGQVPTDAQKGISYFEGTTPFVNGGPPCKTCHQISDLNITGGSVGPDLSTALNFTKFNGNVTSLKIFLTSPDTPTMKSIWGAAPLNSGEIDALASLLQYAAEKGQHAPPPPTAVSASYVYYMFFTSSSLVGLGIGLLIYILELRSHLNQT